MAARMAVLAVGIFGALLVAPAWAQERLEPPLHSPGDIVAAGMGVNPETGEVMVGFEVSRVLEARRYAPGGQAMDVWRTLISRESTTIAVNGLTRELYEAYTARGAIVVTRWRDDGAPIDTWDTGFTGFATDVETEPWGGEVLVGQFDGQALQLLSLSRDGALLSSWSSGYADPAGCVTLTNDRRYFLGVAAQEGSGGRVARYDDLGGRTAEWPVDERPVAMGMGPENSLYVATRTNASHLGSVIVLSDYGTVRETWPLGARPLDIEVMEDGRAYLLLLQSQGRALQVLELGPDGRPMRSFMALMRLLLPTVG